MIESRVVSQINYKSLDDYVILWILLALNRWVNFTGKNGSIFSRKQHGRSIQINCSLVMYVANSNSLMEISRILRMKHQKSLKAQDTMVVFLLVLRVNFTISFLQKMLLKCMKRLINMDCILLILKEFEREAMIYKKLKTRKNEAIIF